DHEGERVVDLVRDAGREPPERLELLGAAQLGLHAMALRHLALEAIVRLADRLRAREHLGLELVDLRACLAREAPLARERRRELADLDVVEGLLEDEEALGVGLELTEELFPRVVRVGRADDDLELRIDLPEAQRGLDAVPA